MTDRTVPDAHPLRPGDPTSLGAYEIIGRLGEGGQGSVFLGRPRGPMAPADGAVAIKLLHAGLTADPSARGRFVRELEVAKRVARFCTAQILDADVSGDQPYIVSEYVPGSSLYKLVTEEGPRTGGALERLAVSTLTALTAIHRAGIVHRDFKPHNVMMGPDGPRVIDFGVARALGGGDTQNVGTPAYMAPEHFNGDTVGPPADMFAWGTTMVFAATGRPAFGNDEMGAVMHRILTGEPDLGGLPEPLRGVVAACLAKDPALRPSAQQAQERLVGADSAGPLPPAMPLATPHVGAGGPQAPMAGAAYPAPPRHAPGTGGTASFGSPSGPAGPAGSGGATGPTGPMGPPPPERPRRGVAVPVAAAAAVAALLIGGSVWALTRSGGEGTAEAGTGTAATSTGRAEDGLGGPGGEAGAAPNGLHSPEESPTGKRGKPGKPVKPKDGKTSPAGKKPHDDQPRGDQPSGGTGDGGGGGDSAPEPTNPYSPQAVCNSGGHGGGYYVQRSTAFAGGVVYQLYNSSGYNCAVTIKTKDVGKASSVWTKIESQGGGSGSDSGSFQYYAGPAFVYAKGQCVRYSGGTSTGSGSASWGNCG